MNKTWFYFLNLLGKFELSNSIFDKFWHEIFIGIRNKNFFNIVWVQFYDRAL